MVAATSPSGAPDLRPAAPARRSGLYEGTIGHRRHIDVGHGFSQPIVMAYLDLDEVDHVFDSHPLWSSHRIAPVRFRRRDMHGDPDLPLDVAIRRTVSAQLGAPPSGPIRVLTHLRHWGWTFNPISLYFCFDGADTRVETVVAEVTNTPWHERHAYVLAVPGPADAAATGVRFAKRLHVSPFMDLDLDHVLRFTPPGREHLTVEMDDHRREDQRAAQTPGGGREAWSAAPEQPRRAPRHRPVAERPRGGPGQLRPAPADPLARSGELVFSARLVLDRLPLDRDSMAHVLRHHAVPSHRVSAGIYRNALRLWRKGAPFRHHPHRSTT